MTIHRQNTPKPRAVEIVMFSDAQVLDVAGPLQVFASANNIAAQSDQELPYRVRVVAPETPVPTSAGLALLADPLPPHGKPVDALIVAGGQGVFAACENKLLVAWLTRRAERARRVASVCNGAFLLAAAGLLDGRRVVTHWADCAKLAENYPKVQVETNPIFVRDGSIWTSAGVTAGIDMSLDLVEQDLGPEIALAISRELVVFLKRSGGQDQFSSLLTLQSEAEDFAPLHAWIADHLTADLTVPALAAWVGKSERSFIRHYKARTGVTPSRAVERIRVEAARHLLTSTKLPIKRIVRDCGFGSAETLRRGFLRVLGTTPQAYRASFDAVERED